MQWKCLIVTLTHFTLSEPLETLFFNTWLQFQADCFLLFVSIISGYWHTHVWHMTLWQKSGSLIRNNMTVGANIQWCSPTRYLTCTVFMRSRKPPSIFLKHKFYCLNVNSIRAQIKIIQTEEALELNYSKQRFYLNPRTIKLTVNTGVVLVLAFRGFNPPERNKKHVSQSQLQ